MSTSIRNIVRRMLPVLLVAVASLTARGGMNNNPLSQLDNVTGIESTYVSGRFANSFRQWQNLPGVRSLGINQGFSSLSSYVCYSESAVRQADRIIRKYIEQSSRLELVMKVSRDKEDYRVYEKFNADDRLVQLIIWNGGSPNYCELVVIDWKDGIDVSEGAGM